MNIKTSGKKQEFGTGAHRDAQENKGRFDLIPVMPLRRLAKHYEGGANLYGENNWKKGIPLRRFLDSAIRHTLQLLEGKDDEDHAAATLWNICGFMYTKDAIERGILPKELDNIDTEVKIEPAQEVEEKLHHCHGNAKCHSHLPSFGIKPPGKEFEKELEDSRLEVRVHKCHCEGDTCDDCEHECKDDCKKSVED